MIFLMSFSKNENYKFVRTMRLNPGQSFDLSKEVSDGVYIKRDEKNIQNIKQRFIE